MELLDGGDARVLELRSREPLFHRLPGDSGRAAVDAIAAPPFFEVGASGNLYTREFVLDVVADRYENGLEPDDDSWAVDDFQVHQLGESIYLATYALRHRGAPSRRSTIWQHDASGWTALYHQGTPAS